MYAGNLIETSTRAFPEKFDPSNTREFYQLATRNERAPVYEPAPVVDEMRNNLHLLDMTLSDYTNLMRDSVGTSLLRLKNDPEFAREVGLTYEEVIERLQRPSMNESDLDRLFDVLARKPIGLFDPELKIPVSVPSSALIPRD